ncbi:MAG TPA: hypothetical protein VK009_02630 [Chloroflexota bacterium]|nr:hypothetical protein [Chloroflexota bacterium]
MAINPVSGSLSFLDTTLPTAATSTSSTTQAPQSSATPTAPITTDQLAEMEAAAIDPNLIGGAASANSSVLNSFTTMLGGDGSSSSGDPLLDALNGTNAQAGSSGDPLLDALNAQDANAQANQSGSGDSADTLLSSSLSSFLGQQAATSYLNAQAMDNPTPASGTNLTSA